MLPTTTTTMATVGGSAFKPADIPEYMSIENGKEGN